VNGVITLLLHRAVRKMEEIIYLLGAREKFLYFDSIRINPRLFQQDINVYGPCSHDLSILDFLIERKPVFSQRLMVFVMKETISENIAYVTLRYDYRLQ